MANEEKPFKPHAENPIADTKPVKPTNPIVDEKPARPKTDEEVRKEVEAKQKEVEAKVKAKKEENEAKKKELLDRVTLILKEHNNKESEVPLNNEYWGLLNELRGL